jgi:hypothetical protein
MYINDASQTRGVHLALLTDDTSLYTTDRKEGFVVRIPQRGLSSASQRVNAWISKLMKIRLGWSTSLAVVVARFSFYIEWTVLCRNRLGDERGPKPKYGHRHLPGTPRKELDLQGGYTVSLSITSLSLSGMWAIWGSLTRVTNHYIYLHALLSSLNIIYKTEWTLLLWSGHTRYTWLFLSLWGGPFSWL